MGAVSTPGLRHLQDRVLSRLCQWQWEVVHCKNTRAGYCLSSTPCPQRGGSHPRSHIPAYAFICLIQCLHAFAVPDPLLPLPSPAQTNEPQALPSSLPGCRLVPRWFLVPSWQPEGAVCALCQVSLPWSTRGHPGIGIPLPIFPVTHLPRPPTLLGHCEPV